LASDSACLLSSFHRRAWNDGQFYKNVIIFSRVYYSPLSA